MRPLAVAVCATLLAGAWLEQAQPALASRQVSPALAMIGESPPLRLGLVDVQTLRPLPSARLEVGLGGCASRSGGTACWSTPAWARSPEGMRLALARNDGYGARSLRIVDVRRMRVVEDVPLRGLPLGGLAWMAPDRVVALQEVCCAETQQVIAIDLARRRVETGRKLGGSIVRIGRTARELVLLLAPAGGIGPARLAVVDAMGTVRFVPVDGVAAGSKLVDAATFLMERQLPGLAVDPAARRAYVTGTGTVAEVDLRTLAVDYHPMRATASLAKASRGAVHDARWLGGGLLALTGEQLSLAAGEQRSEPAGLSVLDTRTWSTREIDPRATGVVLWRDLLLATGVSSAGGSRTGFGLAAYGLDGGLRFRVLADRDVCCLGIVGARAYVSIAGSGGAGMRTAIVALPSGAILGESPGPPPPAILVTAAAVSWWEPPS